ncbi:hypothetical protein PanWU01x14_313380, partial [Parasponia andersonii]
MAELDTELLDYDPHNPLPVSEDQALEWYLSVESFFMVKNPNRYVLNSVLMGLRDRGLLVIFK